MFTPVFERHHVVGACYVLCVVSKPSGQADVWLPSVLSPTACISYLGSTEVLVGGIEAIVNKVGTIKNIFDTVVPGNKVSETSTRRARPQGYISRAPVVRGISSW